MTTPAVTPRDLDVGRLLRRAAEELRGSGIDSPDLDAEVLLAHCLSVPRRAIRVARVTGGVAGRQLSTGDLDAYAALLARRRSREPLQHIVGKAPFRGLTLAVGPGVFVPRPETEVLVGWALDVLRDLRAAGLETAAPETAAPNTAAPDTAAPDTAAPNTAAPDTAAPDTSALASGAVPGELLVVDACAGTGAVALAIAAEDPRVRVWAVENDRKALQWARRNRADLGVPDAAGIVPHAALDGPHPRQGARSPAERVEVVEGDVTNLGAGLCDELRGRVSLLVSNPPYVPTGSAVSPEATADPPEALWGGPDGLSVIRSVVAAAERLLVPGGWAGVEHDETTSAAVRALFAAENGWAPPATHADLAGRDRFTCARRVGGVR